MQTVFTGPVDPAILTPLQNAIEQDNIRYLIPSYVDLHGIPKTKIVPVAFLEKMLKGSECFTGQPFGQTHRSPLAHRSPLNSWPGNRKIVDPVSCDLLA